MISTAVTGLPSRSRFTNNPGRSIRSLVCMFAMALKAINKVKISTVRIGQSGDTFSLTSSSLSAIEP